MNFDTPIQFIKGVGPKMAKKFAHLGVNTVGDLIYYFPRAWLDLSQINNIRNLRINDEAIIKAKIKSINNHRSARKRMLLTSALVEDNSGEMELVWFNQAFLAKNFSVGEEYIFYGKVSYDFNKKTKTIVSPNYEKNPVIIPIYNLTEGITSKYIRKIIQNVLNGELEIKDFLPQDIVEKENIFNLNEALNQIHFPISQEYLSRAKERLAFDELLLLALRVNNIRCKTRLSSAYRINLNRDEIKSFIENLPYRLTNAQKKAAWEILQDISKPFPANRLLEGDVGSGKTVVAAIAAYNSIINGYRVAWMAPTEVLATQHFKTVSKLFEKYDISVGLITGGQIRIKGPLDCAQGKQGISGKQKSKSQLKSIALRSNLIIGTHALIQDKIKIEKLALVIVDEQHRFGVNQRALITDRSANQNVPHFLSMTATPIPRTLALTIYGELDISILDEMPPGRIKIITRVVDPVNRDKAYNFIRKQINNGRQAFVICPLIAVSSQPSARSLFELDRKSVEGEYEKLSKNIFPDLRVAMLHGKLKPKEKQKIMDDFKNKKFDIIVSTSVIEVGIDIQNANVMVVEDADRFGLAQLHQFRGRVGRGKEQSYCLLFTNSLSPKVINRLNIMQNCADGFSLAQKDLETRGPGEFAGLSQHGMPDLKMASLTDVELIKETQEIAAEIFKKDINKYPLLLDKIKEFETINHLE